MNKIEKNVLRIRQRIAEAALRAGRDTQEIILLAAGKNRTAEEIRGAIEAGVDCVGENRVQELLKKIEALGNLTEWHFIGHLQRNKVKYLPGKVSMIHSVDSLGLAKEISKRALLAGEEIPVLLQLNIAGEESKFGFEPGDIYNVIDEMLILKGVRLVGLSTIAPFTRDAEEVRWVFRCLRETKDQIEDRFGIEFKHLSMGMTNDFECAIEEGSTIVRLGTAIFEGI